MNQSASVWIKLFLAVYAGLIIFIGKFQAHIHFIFDTFFMLISIVASVLYISYLNTRSVIEITVLDRNALVYTTNFISNIKCVA